MSKTQGIYKIKNKELTYSTYFAWLILNTPEVYKRVVANNWTYGYSPCNNDIIVKILFTAEHENSGKELACVQEVVTKSVYIIDTSALELDEEEYKEKKDKSFLDRLCKQELTFLQEIAEGNLCRRDCDTCILNSFLSFDCEKLAKDLLEKLE